MTFREMSSKVQFSHTQKFSGEMVYLGGPHLAGDLVEEDFVVIEGNRASKGPMRQCLREKLRKEATKV